MAIRIPLPAKNDPNKTTENDFLIIRLFSENLENMSSWQEIVESFNSEAIVIFWHYDTYTRVSNKQNYEKYVYLI